MNASIGKVEGSVITLLAISAPIAKMIASDSNLGTLRRAIDTVAGAGWSIKVEVDSASAVPAGPPMPLAPTELVAPAEPLEMAEPAARTEPAIPVEPSAAAEPGVPAGPAPPAEPGGQEVVEPASKASRSRGAAAARAAAAAAVSARAEVRATPRVAKAPPASDEVDEIGDQVRSSTNGGATAVEAALTLLRDNLGARSLTD